MKKKKLFLSAEKICSQCLLFCWCWKENSFIFPLFGCSVIFVLWLAALPRLRDVHSARDGLWLGKYWMKWKFCARIFANGSFCVVVLWGERGRAVVLGCVINEVYRVFTFFGVMEDFVKGLFAFYGHFKVFFVALFCNYFNEIHRGFLRLFSNQKFQWRGNLSF